MVNSLQDQLLNAGLVDKKQIKQSQKQQRKEKKKQPKGQQTLDDEKLRAQQNKAKKVQRDRELNQQRNQQAERVAMLAQVKQLIVTNRIEVAQKSIAYQFVDGKLIKRLFVDEQSQALLSNGQLAIAKYDQTYAMVPLEVAEKILQRDSASIVLLNTPSRVEDDDPYAEYQVPDDLMW